MRSSAVEAGAPGPARSEASPGLMTCVCTSMAAPAPRRRSRADSPGSTRLCPSSPPGDPDVLSDGCWLPQALTTNTTETTTSRRKRATTFMTSSPPPDLARRLVHGLGSEITLLPSPTPPRHQPSLSLVIRALRNRRRTTRADSRTFALVTTLTAAPSTPRRALISTGSPAPLESQDLPNASPLEFGRWTINNRGTAVDYGGAATSRSSRPPTGSLVCVRIVGRRQAPPPTSSRATDRRRQRNRWARSAPAHALGPWRRTSPDLVERTIQDPDPRTGPASESPSTMTRGRFWGGVGVACRLPLSGGRS